MSKCVVFDFDCTLTHRHFYHFINNYDKFKKLYNKELNNWNEIEKLKERTKPFFNGKTSSINKNDVNLITKLIFGGKKRLEMIRLLLYKLYINDISLHISSRGLTHQINRLLKLYCFNNYFSLVNGNNCTFIYKKDNNGQIIINDIIETKSKIDFFEKFIFDKYNIITYIDDDHEEHKIMIKYKKYHFIDSLKKENGGISIDEIKKIKNIYKLL